MSRKLSNIGSSFDNTFNAINKRLDALAEQFGKDTAAYNEYESIIRKNFEYRVNKAGNVQIKRGKANANLNRFQKQALNFLLKGGKTVGSMNAAAKQALLSEDKEITKDAIREMAIKQDYVNAHNGVISKISDQENIDALPDSLKNLYNRAAGRSDELSYSELYNLMVEAAPDAAFIGIW